MTVNLVSICNLMETTVEQMIEQIPSLKCSVTQLARAYHHAEGKAIVRAMKDRMAA